MTTTIHPRQPLTKEQAVERCLQVMQETREVIRDIAFEYPDWKGRLPKITRSRMERILTVTLE